MRPVIASEGKPEPFDLPFKVFLLFLVSFFLHLTARVPVLGVVRFDMLLVMWLGYLTYKRMQESRVQVDPQARATAKWIIALFVWVLISLPLVRWPGTVLNLGLESFIKASMFFFFAMWLVDTERKLRWMVATFVICNVIRVLEPLGMHFATGYWGSQTYLGDGEMANRLAGAPSDVINPNGLAFVIASVLPFLHYLIGKGFLRRVIYLLLLAVLLLAMKLTLSRTGFLALAIIAFAIFWKSQHKVKLALAMVGVVLAFFASLDDITRERYLSLTGDENVRGSATSKGRLEGLEQNWEAAQPRIVVGHGLRTSRETNFHFSGHAQPAHNLYLEILQELGLVGLGLFLCFMNAIVKNFRQAKLAMAKVQSGDSFLVDLTNALQVWLLMNILFSFASYGLTSYEWYLFGGLSVVVLRLAMQQAGGESGGAPLPLGRRRKRR